MVRVASHRGHSPQHTKAASFIRWLDDHDCGHIEQTGRNAQPQLTGTRHHYSPIKINSKLCRGL